MNLKPRIILRTGTRKKLKTIVNILGPEYKISDGEFL